MKLFLIIAHHGIHLLCVVVFYKFQQPYYKHCEARIRYELTAEMFKIFPSVGSMHASVKLEGIDGRAPQERVEHVA